MVDDYHNQVGAEYSRSPGVIPALSYSLAQAAWIPRIAIWRDDGTTLRREGKPCQSWAAAMVASWRLASPSREVN
jgi:hypothetical protein